MATAELPRSMNDANERDPYNNNCYGTLVDGPYLQVTLPVLDVHDFNDRVIRGGGWDTWDSRARYCRSAIRSYNYFPYIRYGVLGFRVVLAPGQP